jgi:hypothetical protein
MKAWLVLNAIAKLQSPWLTVIAERLQDEQGHLLDYWRIEKADSLVILPIQAETLLLPSASYRPGIACCTLDFPGGRIDPTQSLESVAHSILKRELGIPAAGIRQLQRLNPEGWAVNSSFSNQKLFGMVAQIEPTLVLDRVGSRFPCQPAGIQSLRQQLTCLQCRAVLQEWLMMGSFPPP